MIHAKYKNNKAGNEKITEGRDKKVAIFKGTQYANTENLRIFRTI